MNGYAPLSNYQELLQKRVIRLLEQDTELQSVLNEQARSAPEVSEEEIPLFEERLVEPPESRMESENVSAEVEGTRIAQKINYVEREARNQQLGKRGEKFVVSLEKKRHGDAGEPDLASQVEWVAESRGEGLGYDVLFHDENGQERYIEVKKQSGYTTPILSNITRSAVLRRGW